MRRIFIGVPVQRRLQGRINRLLAPVSKGNKEIRWVTERNRHLTLAFLGDQPDEVVEALAGEMDDVFREQPPFDAGFTAMARFPDSRGHILALVGREDDRLSALFKATCRFLAPFGLGPEFETFRPHITLGRIIRPRLVKTKYYEPADILLHVDRITLYQSTLTPNGSVYLALKETVLGLTDAGPD